VVFFGILHLKPKDALTFGAVLQTARLMGGELGSAFVATLSRKREQIASNLIGLHVQMGDPRVLHRIDAYGAATTHTLDPGGAVQRGQQVLGFVVHAAATTQAVMDAFVAIGVLAVAALLFMVSRREPPAGPASPLPLFPLRKPALP
jgi:DHA2 family multidrug resistance protein